MTGETMPEPKRAYVLLRQLTYTPLSDLLRGSLSARLDYRVLIAKAELPVPLHLLIQQIVAATGLWTGEKLDFTRELIAHFEDGLSAGQSVDELLASFGDPAAASKLIRRAKKQGRPLIWRATARATQCTCILAGALVAALLCAYAVSAIRVHTGSPTISRNFVAEYNAKVAAIPERERAWPIYVQAYRTAGVFPEDLERAPLDPTREEWKALTAFAAANGEAIRLYRQAVAKPALGMMLGDMEGVLGDEPGAADACVCSSLADTDENPALLNLRLANLIVFPHASRLLSVDARNAMQRGDTKCALADIEALLGMGELSAEAPFFMSALIGTRIVREGLELALRLLHGDVDQLTSSQLICLSHRLADLRDGGLWHFDVEMGRAEFEDFVQRHYTDDGTGDGYIVREFRQALYGDSEFTEDGALPIMSLLVAGRREITQKHDRFLRLVAEEYEQRLWERGESVVDLEICAGNRGALHQIRYLPLSSFVYSLSYAGVEKELTRQYLDATLVAIALRLWHRSNGSYPRALEELTPGLLPTVPQDRYDGKSIKYRLIDGLPVLYSVGADRDDDSGRMTTAQSPFRANILASSWVSPALLKASRAGRSGWQVPDGDWILWPPVYRSVRSHDSE